VKYLQKTDPEIFNAIQKELKRQNENIELIASENFTFFIGFRGARLSVNQ